MLAIVGGKLLTACMEGGRTPPEIREGVILVDRGKIIGIGGRDLAIPSEARILEASSCVVSPGFIDAHSHIGIMEDGLGWAGNDANEATDPNTGDIRALDAINPADRAFAEAIEGGVTTVQVMPGSANVIGGEIVTIKCKGTVVDQMVLRRPSGVKAALGENPKGVYGGAKRRPATRMGNAAVMREVLAQASDHVRKRGGAKSCIQEHIDSDLGLEMIGKVIRREIPLRIHAHREDDIVTAVRIKDEFQIDISIEHCTNGDKVASMLATKGIPCAVGPIGRPRTKLESRDKGPHVAVELAAAGVKMCIISDHPVLPQQWLRITAGLAIREGLAEDTALAACTRNAAEIIGVSDRIGTLEPGKDADIVVWSGDPFEYNTVAKLVLIDGRIAYQKECERVAELGEGREELW